MLLDQTIHPGDTIIVYRHSNNPGIVEAIDKDGWVLAHFRLTSPAWVNPLCILKIAEAPPVEPSIKTRFTVSCCFYTGEANTAHTALDSLLKHIEENHPEYEAELYLRARLLARSQNGSGYLDTNWCDGWTNAHAGFKRAWAIEALKEKL
jgi:hypothetical protein